MDNCEICFTHTVFDEDDVRVCAACLEDAAKTMKHGGAERRITELESRVRVLELYVHDLEVARRVGPLPGV